MGEPSTTGLGDRLSSSSTAVASSPSAAAQAPCDAGRSAARGGRRGVPLVFISGLRGPRSWSHNRVGRGRGADSGHAAVGGGDSTALDPWACCGAHRSWPMRTQATRWRQRQAGAGHRRAAERPLGTVRCTKSAPARARLLGLLVPRSASRRRASPTNWRMAEVVPPPGSAGGGLRGVVCGNSARIPPSAVLPARAAHPCGAASSSVRA